MILTHKLELGVEEQEKFLFSLAQARIAAGIKRMDPKQRERLRAPPSLCPERELDKEVFIAVSDWYHYAIIELTRLTSFQTDEQWIAGRLGITKPEVRAAIERLLALKLLESINGTLLATSFHLQIGNKTETNGALRKRQRQIIEKSLWALDHVPIEQRNHSARTVAISKENITIAKSRIDQFMIKLCDELGSGQRDEVYELAVQLFPLSRVPEAAL